MNKKLFKAGLIVFSWGVFAFSMSILYYWLKDKGLVWDNPEFYKDPNGNWCRYEATWNSRKVIFGLLSLCSFVLMIVSVVFVFDEPKEK